MAPDLPIDGLDLISLWHLVKRGSMSAEFEGVGSFRLDRDELVMDIEEPKIWYDIFELMVPTLHRHVRSQQPVRRQRMFPFQLFESYKSRILETVRTVPTADLLLKFTEVIRGLANQLNAERKTVIIYYSGVKIFKMGYRTAGFVPTLVGVKNIEVVDYVTMLDFLNDLALQTNFFRGAAAAPAPRR